MVNRLMAREDIGTLYFDCYRYQVEDLPDYNMVKAEEFAKKFPGRPIKNIAPVIAALRMQKDEDEIALVRQAIKITDDALKFVMKNLKPGCTEYQAQADFEYKIFHEEQTEPHSRRSQEAVQTERCCTTTPTVTCARMRPCF